MTHHHGTYIDVQCTEQRTLWPTGKNTGMRPILDF